MTIDFSPPLLSDPIIAGQINAANALSDIYAMGGKPITCLNIVSYPMDLLGLEYLQDTLIGMLQKIIEAKAILVGGHTIKDERPLLGLSVLGQVHPDKFWSNSKAKIGDTLVLTKPIGAGVIFSAHKKSLAPKKALDECIEYARTLNNIAAEIMKKYTINAATDVTGFGLAGHLLEIATGSKVTCSIDIQKIPIMAQSIELYKNGLSTGITASNWDTVNNDIQFEVDLPLWYKLVLADPQTNGGLLVSVPCEQGSSLLKSLHEAGINSASIIGEVKKLQDKYILIQ